MYHAPGYNPGMGVNLVPFVRNFSITHEDADAHSIEDGCITPGRHRLLRFDFLSCNIGDTDLVVGSPESHPEWFELSASHGHYHLKNFNEFRLYSSSGTEVVKGYKQAFCLIDIERLDPNARSEPRFDDCNASQGISAGWADVYSASLACQFLVIDDLPSGSYVLKSTTNVPRYFSEDSFDDNTICTGLRIVGDTVTEIPTLFPCRTSPPRHWGELVARILFGVTHDGGGAVWTPGRGPMPVDPWGPLTGAERDILTTLALATLAGQVEDEGIRGTLRMEALEGLLKAAKQLKEQGATRHR